MKNKLVSVAAALALALPHTIAAPAHADVPPVLAEVPPASEINQKTDPATEEGSSDGEKAALIVGSILAVLAAVGGGAVWAISQGLIANPLPGILPSPQRTTNRAPAQRATRAPLTGEPCTWNQVLQPALGRDGKWLVCVASPDPTWVLGVKPRGIGTAREGAYCTERETGGQDSRGRLMMCLNNEWIYGP